MVTRIVICAFICLPLYLTSDYTECIFKGCT